MRELLIELLRVFSGLSPVTLIALVSIGFCAAICCIALCFRHVVEQVVKGRKA